MAGRMSGSISLKNMWEKGLTATRSPEDWAAVSP